MKEETGGKFGTTARSTSRLVKALLHTAAVFTTRTNTSHLLSTEFIRDLLATQNFNWEACRSQLQTHTHVHISTPPTSNYYQVIKVYRRAAESIQWYIKNILQTWKKHSQNWQHSEHYPINWKVWWIIPYVWSKNAAPFKNIFTKEVGVRLSRMSVNSHSWDKTLCTGCT